MKNICAVVLNWNRREETIECLESLGNLSLPKGYSFRVVVVDNGSTDGSREVFENLSSKIENVYFVETGNNLGYAGGNNFGIKYCLEKLKSDLILVINNDIVPDKDFLLPLIDEVEKEGVGIACPKVYFAKGFEFHKERYKRSELGRVIWYAGGRIDWNNVFAIHIGLDIVDSRRFNKRDESEFATGSCMLVKQQIFESVGLFDEKYFLYWEDIDFSVRVRRAGFKIIYQPNARVWHKVSSSSGIGSKLNDYFLTRNRLYFGFKYAPLHTKLSLVKQAIKMLFNSASWQKRGIIDYAIGRMGKGSWR